MYTREELKAIRTVFWSDFKTHMSKHRSSNGRRMNWLNYPSEIPFIFIRLEADGKGARLLFDIQAKDNGVRAVIWEQMHELKVVLETEMGHDGVWMEDCSTPAVSLFNRIYWEDNTLNFFDPTHKKAIFAFLEDRLLHFDTFYQNFKDILTSLAN
jgi:hypothetical protein